MFARAIARSVAGEERLFTGSRRNTFGFSRPSKTSRFISGTRALRRTTSVRSAASCHSNGRATELSMKSPRALRSSADGASMSDVWKESSSMGYRCFTSTGGNSTKRKVSDTGNRVELHSKPQSLRSGRPQPNAAESSALRSGRASSSVGPRAKRSLPGAMPGFRRPKIRPTRQVHAVPPGRSPRARGLRFQGIRRT
jgi:hypothetical protein